MNKFYRVNFKHILLTLLLVFALVLSYLAGTISVEAKFSLGETQATTNQISAVSAAVSLLLLGSGQGETLYLPLIVK